MLKFSAKYANISGNLNICKHTRKVGLWLQEGEEEEEESRKEAFLPGRQERR